MDTDFFGDFGPPTGLAIDTTIYPTVAGLQAFLTSAGVLPNPMSVEASSLPWETWAVQAMREWERSTGWKPFLADLDEKAVSYMPDDSGTRVLDIRGGFIAVSEVKAADRVLVENVDYCLMPTLARFDDEPFTYIEFRTYHSCLLTVKGRRGYCEELPADVYSAILSRAALLAFDVLRNSSLANAPVVQREKQDGVEYEYATSVTERGALAKSWESTWDAAVAHYKLVTII